MQRLIVMNKYVEISKKFVCSILSNGEEPTINGIAEILEIKRGNKELLLEHLKAITNIMNKAIKELEKVDSNE